MPGHHARLWIKQMTSYLEQLFSLEEKVAIVTGASRGIGAAIACGFSSAGAHVVGFGRSLKPDWDKNSISAGSLEYRICDITDEEQLESQMGRIYKQEKRLDILVNAAGITLPINETDSKQKMLAKFDKMIQVNLRAAYSATMLAANFMHDNCSIINITSINSIVGFPGNPGYVASKGGLRMLTKALSIDLASRGIRVNAIALGYFRTAMTAHSYADTELRAKRLERMIIKRYGEPNEVVGAAIFLASEASSYITGQDICIDGGWTAKGMD